MNILAIEPYYSDSHKQFLDGLVKHSTHEITTLAMPGRFWKWRNCGSGIYISGKFSNIQKNFDLILVSDFLNVPDFIALNKKKLAQTPIVLYMHENQITYPDHITGSLDRAYPLLNISSCAVSDWILFNSEYHRSSFLEALPEFIEACPDYRPKNLIKEITEKSSVLPLGLDLNGFDKSMIKKENLILWNHRWEHDKNPELFIDTMINLRDSGINFKLAILGKKYKKVPDAFKKAERLLKKHIDYFGFVENVNEYKRIVSISDFVVSSANHDFFGVSIAEAVYAGAVPVLPHKLNYPYLVPEDLHDRLLYKNDRDFLLKLKNLLEKNISSGEKALLSCGMEKFRWEKLINEYDNFFSGLMTND